MRAFACGLVPVVLMACNSTTSKLHLPPLPAVPHVDITRYMGLWYEIASFPEVFQRGCLGTQAHYTLAKDGRVEVVNRCKKDSLQGDWHTVFGVARVVEPKSCAKLEVSFWRPFWGSYWIVDLDPGYQYAVVGHPGRDHLWVLSRTPQMNTSTYQGILQRLKAVDYDVSRLRLTVQAPAAAAGPSA